MDLSAYIAGPYGCSLLADLGAEVIKIEPPTGDTLRQYPSTLEPEARAFLGTNRSKLGIVLDLKQQEGQKVLLRLVEVHNFRPSVPRRLGIEYERLRQLNPRLIYCALTGYGESGPLKEKAGYDQILQSLTGICTFQGTADKPEIVLGSVVDFYAASQIAYGVTAALFDRERTGEGQCVGVSLLRSALGMARPLVFSKSPGPEPFAAPCLGQHTEDGAGALWILGRGVGATAQEKGHSLSDGTTTMSNGTLLTT